MKVLSIIGARPQFIKSVPISRELLRLGVKEIVVHTGQHYDTNMSEIFFKQMKIPVPHYFLNINNLSHGAMTAKMMLEIESVLINEKPDVVVVYGDTNSTLAGALTAAKLQISLAHIEAGLRSFNMNMPEEINRILTDRISNYLFCPTQASVSNLMKEGFSDFDCKIILSGDVMYDSVNLFSSYEINPEYRIIQPYVLCTLHRQENTDDPERLESIFSALNEISKSILIVLPLHPRTKKILIESKLINKISKNVYLTEPVGYLEMLYLLKRCEIVMTDSGGLQKEAYFFEKSCLTLRDQTEWIELVEIGVNFICGSNTEKIINIFNKIKDVTPSFKPGLYGEGRSAQLIVGELIK